MKKLAKDSLRKLTVILLLLVFVISNLISFTNNKKAQSNFAKNSLSFLLLEEDSADFEKTIEKFNNAHKDVSIVYMDKNRKVIANPSEMSIAMISKADLKEARDYGFIDNRKYKGSFETKSQFIGAGKNFLILSMNNSLSFYLNIPVLITCLILGLISFMLIDKNVDRDVDQYIDGLSSENIDEYLYTSKYDDMRALILSYQERLNSYKNEANELAERMAEFISVTSNMKEGFIIFDGDGNIELMNESASRYLRVSSDTNIRNLIDDKEYTLALREASILKRSKSLDIKLNENYLRIFIDPLQSATKKAFAMIIIDNTEDKKAEQMRKEFSANVTHELKSPLTSINGYAELIATGIAKEDDIAKFGEIIYKEGNRLLDIIDDILKISRLDEKNFERDFTELDIYEVVTSTIEKFDRQTNHKNIKVTNNVKPYRINTSKSLFYDLFSNIYENAIKYNKIGGSITVSYELKDNSYFLTIADTGIGIAQADVNRIFERFYVVDKSRKRNQKSTGLGLSIVKHIAGYLGYEIKVKSRINEGSEFTIVIPLELDREI